MTSLGPATVRVDTTEESLAALCERITYLPGRSFRSLLDQLEMLGPPLVDSNNPDHTFTGNLQVDLSLLGLSPTGPALDDEAGLGVFVTAIIIDLLHELAEHTRTPAGSRVLQPHTPDEREWGVLTEVSRRASSRLLADHPRPGRPAPRIPGDAASPSVTDETADRLGQLLRWVTILPGTSFDVGAGQVEMLAPDVEDVESPGAMFTGGVSLDLEGFDLPVAAGEVTIDDAVRVAMATTLVSGLHEAMEWLRLDGRRPFCPHTPAFGEWAVLVSVASEAIERMLAQHPRPA